MRMNSGKRTGEWRGKWHSTMHAYDIDLVDFELCQVSPAEVYIPGAGMISTRLVVEPVLWFDRVPCWECAELTRRRSRAPVAALQAL